MTRTPDGSGFRRRILLLGSGAAAAVAVGWYAGAEGLAWEAQATAGTTVFTAWCWLTGVLPLAVSALLPAMLLPATGAVPASVVAPSYFHDVLMLFLGGFILAIALQRYGLHKRFALTAMGFFGTRPARLVLGFMVTACCLSMFISNTSTALLMLPVALAVLDDFGAEDGRRLARPLLLGIAYSCSIGGVATPIGTAPNVVFLGQLRDRFPDAPVLGFGTWMMGALPFVVVFLLVAWFVLTRVVFRMQTGPANMGDLEARRRELGPRNQHQNRVLAIFAAVALLWITRQGVDFDSWSIPGWQSLLPEKVAASVSDSTVALLAVMLLFIVPGEAKKTGALLDWEDTVKVPWGILLLLGGGFALAKAIEISGLSAAVGDSLGGAVGALPPFTTMVVLVLVVTFLTEITSNTATISVLLPLLFSAAVAAKVHPMLLALPATIAVSCAFMLPVATPPNAILFSSGRITVPEMARAGVLLNVVTAVLVSAFVYLWIAPAWGFDLAVFPAWAE